MVFNHRLSLELLLKQNSETIYRLMYTFGLYFPYRDYQQYMGRWVGVRIQDVTLEVLVFILKIRCVR